MTNALQTSANSWKGPANRQAQLSHNLREMSNTKDNVAWDCGVGAGIQGHVSGGIVFN